MRWKPLTSWPTGILCVSGHCCRFRIYQNIQTSYNLLARFEDVRSNEKDQIRESLALEAKKASKPLKAGICERVSTSQILWL